MFIRQGGYQEGNIQVPIENVEIVISNNAPRFQVQIPETYPDGDVSKVVFSHQIVIQQDIDKCYASQLLSRLGSCLVRKVSERVRGSEVYTDEKTQLWILLL